MVEEIQECLEQENYFAALTMVLILPDICAEIEKGEKSKRVDYEHWCDKWLHDLFPDLLIKINGEEGWGKIIYQIRCSVLHNGEVDISPQDYKLSRKGEVLFSLEDFNLYIETRDDGCRRVATVDSTRKIDSSGYRCKHKIDVEISHLVQAVLIGVRRFMKEENVSESQFPTLEIYTNP